MPREIIAISLPADLKRKVDKLANEEGLKRSDIIRDALKRYLSFPERDRFAEKEFERLRDKMRYKARVKGIYTDEDVFKIVS
ncbi:CopG family ribbon-helix-helix protein [Candidatus Kryptobacter tengchongensis]|uniref:Ribbon-helix-helix protein, copG family n=1 Tax=Kryptobacter tengchongensis TaxID=1643429 RepID=A0A916LHZ1_KRYT1|nr:ribbon-helix-helix protein, CopG family [Candidatus Kryptobacter tengchongensis]CUS96671.1 Ribbon-helix-helix protein, copG family [Candidatus Kryptobacter tengchongensis]